MNSTPKKEFYSNTVKQHRHYPKGFFNVIYTLIPKGKDLSLQPHESAEEFSDNYFGNIEKIRRDFMQLKGNNLTIEMTYFCT